MGLCRPEYKAAGHLGDRRDPARADREVVEAWRPSDWDAGVWDLVVENAADKMRRTESFRLDHHAIANALEDAGELTFDEVAALVG